MALGTPGVAPRVARLARAGDRLQDNQRRWLAFFAEQGVPAAVCEVRWDASVEASESALG